MHDVPGTEQFDIVPSGPVECDDLETLQAIAAFVLEEERTAGLRLCTMKRMYLKLQNRVISFASKPYKRPAGLSKTDIAVPSISSDDMG